MKAHTEWLPVPLAGSGASVILHRGHQQGVLNSWSIIQATVSSHGSFHVSLLLFSPFVGMRCVWKSCSREAFIFTAIDFIKICAHSFQGMIMGISCEIQWFLSDKHLSFNHFYLVLFSKICDSFLGSRNNGEEINNWHTLI